MIVSEELAQDEAVAFDGYLADELGQRIAAVEGAAFVNGDGSGKPQGFLPIFPVVTAPSGTATTFRFEDLVNALHTVAPSYRERRGAWVMSDGALRALRQVRDTAGQPTLITNTPTAEPPTLLGYPVYVDENMPAPAPNAKSVAFAGWQDAYVIRRVNGVSVQRQIELYSGNGQLGYRASHRVDGRVLTALAGVALQHSAT